MPNQFFNKDEGDLENYFVSEYWLIDQYVGDTLWTWGFNTTNGPLGDNTTTNRSTPVTTFAGGANWKQVSGGGGSLHTAAIKTDGTLWTWGRNNVGQLGDNTATDRSTPVTTFAGGTNWKQVSCGGFHTAAIKTDGTLWTWGSNNFYGQLGDNTGTTRSTPVTTFAGGTNWKQVSCGGDHTAAIKTDGTLWTWGRNNVGQLGDNTLTNRSTPVTTFAGGTNWKQIAGGNSASSYHYTAAIKTDGTLWTWGGNINGQLGNNTTNISFTPITTFSGGTNWKQIAGGNNYIAAIKTDGTLWTWGRNNYGQLGINVAYIAQSNIPLLPVPDTNWQQIDDIDLLLTLSCGNSHTAAIKTDGTLWTWGNNGNGQLGNNTIIPRSTPVTTFAGGTDWKQVSCGGGSFCTAAIKTDGTLWTWGFNSSGQLGDNTIITRSTPVTTFAGGADWKQVACGSNHTAAIKTDGTLWTWGRNSYGNLGNNTGTNRSTPVTTFAGGTNWKQVSSGDNHIVAIKTDGTLWAWGINSFGQLGNNTAADRSTPVTTFAGGTDWKQVSSGQNTIAAIKTDGTLWIWGVGGRLGDNTGTSKSTPVTTFAGGTNWKQVVGGGSHTAAIKTDGTLWTWGNNTSGQLGLFLQDNRLTPLTTFSGGTNWKQVFCGYSTAVIKTDGTLWTWGNNQYGQLGDNTITDRSTPVTTFAGGTNWKQVAGGQQHTAAITSGTDPTIFVS